VVASCSPYADRLEVVRDLVNSGGVWCEISSSIPCTGDHFVVFDEIHQFNQLVSGNTIMLTGNTTIIGAPIDWNLTSVALDTGSVVLTDMAGTTTYVPGTDYNLTAKGVVTRLSTGKIEDLAVVCASYKWSQQCIDPVTGFPNATCRTCVDHDFGNLPTGSIYNKKTRVKCLFHIPTNSYDMAKYGVMMLGDGVVSFPYDINIKVSNFTEGGVLCRDKIKIQGVQGVWGVVQQNSVQVSTFIGKRCVIRKIDFKGING
jgi:hypothetical protein